MTITIAITITINIGKETSIKDKLWYDCINKTYLDAILLGSHDHNHNYNYNYDHNHNYNHNHNHEPNYKYTIENIYSSKHMAIFQSNHVTIKISTQFSILIYRIILAITINITMTITITIAITLIMNLNINILL